jgi:protein SCO1/2
MNRPQRILTTVLWGCVVILMMFFIASWAAVRRQGTRADPPPPQAGDAGVAIKVDAPPIPDVQMPDFSLTTQDANPFTRDDLAGHAWIVDFVFTHCAGPCPLMTEKMAALEKQLPNPNIRFLSFSVDPDRDTPAVLKEYAKQHNADLSRWTFLTGSDATVQAVARALLMPVEHTDDKDRIIHTTKFILTDGHGKMRGFYYFKDDDAIRKLIADANRLVADESKAGPRP